MDIYFFYAMLGLFAGFSSGLLGIGGGVFIVPVLLVLFQQQGIPQAALAQIVSASSLAIMFLISTNSFIHHVRAKNCVWPLVQQSIPSLILGLGLGIYCNRQLSVAGLALILAIILIFMAFYLVYSRHLINTSTPHIAPHWPWYYHGIGFFIGMQAGLVGIGGGVFLIPFMMHIGLPMRRAIGTSTAGILTISFFGMLLHLFFAAPIDQIPHTIGAIFWPAVLLITLTSMLSVPFGVKIATRIDEQKLKFIFAIFLTIISTHLFWKYFSL